MQALEPRPRHDLGFDGTLDPFRGYLGWSCDPKCRVCDVSLRPWSPKHRKKRLTWCGSAKILSKTRPGSPTEPQKRKYMGLGSLRGHLPPGGRIGKFIHSPSLFTSFCRSSFIQAAPIKASCTTQHHPAGPVGDPFRCSIIHPTTRPGWCWQFLLLRLCSR